MTPPLRRQSYATLLECLIVIDHLKNEPESVDAEHVEELLEEVEKLLDVLDPDTHPHYNLSHGPN
jgi:hypothetical protein